MARILIVHRWDPMWSWQSTYGSHLLSYGQHSKHQCFYLDLARLRVPDYIRNLEPDLVVFQYTFLVPRLDPEVFGEMCRLVSFVKNLSAPKVLLSADESWGVDQLRAFINEFGVSQVFTFASPAALSTIYNGLQDAVEFHPVLSGYVDEDTVQRIERLARTHGERPIDIGCRMVAPTYLGRQGQLRGKVVQVFSENAPGQGFRVDLSRRWQDMIWGDGWFEFLLSCRYTLGVETGSSLLDVDGSIVECTNAYVAANPEAPYEEIEDACFPGLDGNLDYRALAPRHLEAVMTRTGQILLEGDYSGVLRPGRHYIELKRDFSNLHEILAQMKDEQFRREMVERAYSDVVASGDYSYPVFAEYFFTTALSGIDEVDPLPASRKPSLRLVWNRLEQGAHRLAVSARRRTSQGIRSAIRSMAYAVLGRERSHRVMARLRGR